MENLGAITSKISSVLAVRPQCFITHPTELASLKNLSLEALGNFARQNGWRVVRRLGGQQIEFYNASTARDYLTDHALRTPFGS